MRLDKQRESDNIEDVRNQGGGGGLGFPGGGRRGRIPVGGAGGGGLSGIVILVVLFFALRACGIDPMQILAGGGVPGGGGRLAEEVAPGQPAASDEMKSFVSKVLAETEDAWTGIFAANGEKYVEPKLVLFSGQVRSACGFAGSGVRPFYCPNDQKIYLDTSFFRQLEQQFGASGDFCRSLCYRA